MAVPKKEVSVHMEDIVKVIEEADNYVLWDPASWKARCRLLDACGFEVEQWEFEKT